MSMIDEHNAAQAQDGHGVSSRNDDPFSLAGVPEGNAGDLMSFGKQAGAIYKPDGTKL